MTRIPDRFSPTVPMRTELYVPLPLKLLSLILSLTASGNYILHPVLIFPLQSSFSRIRIRHEQIVEVPLHSSVTL